MKSRQNLFFPVWLLIYYWLWTFSSCSAPKSLVDRATDIQQDEMEIYIGDSTFQNDLVITKEVTIYPQAMLKTGKKGKITFTKRVNILGESQVFDPDANLFFAPGTLSILNVAWFGAKGYDGEDDTHAFKKALSIAREYSGVINVYVPAGRYFINETLNVVSDENSKKAINLVGASMSNSSIQGSSISWNGSRDSTMVRLWNVNQFRIENIDFTAEPYAYVANNLEFKPFIHQVVIRNCSFSGVTGSTSANIDINAGNNLQVSEIQFENCTFKSVPDSTSFRSMSAIKGGLANTKNFYIKHCSFSGYQKAAIDIEVSDILEVSGCTFAWNKTDISCLLCGTYATSNYSEHARLFFNASTSSNPAFTTLVNNRFSGDPEEGFVVRGGSGSLILMNNYFGASGFGPDRNRVKWGEGNQNPIYSVGNYYKNTNNSDLPFYTSSNLLRVSDVESVNDTGGPDYTNRNRIILSNK